MRQERITFSEYKSEVPAVDTAIRIIEFLSRYRHRRSTCSEIATALGINKSTCLRILRVLQSHRFVSYYSDTKRYSLGVKLVVLGSRALEFIDYLKLVQPHLKWLAQETKQTSVLLEPIGNNRLMYVAKEESGEAKEESGESVRLTVRLGQQFTLTSASYGKCFMAYMSEDEIEDIIREVGLKQFTSRTIVSVEEFKDNLRQVCEKGYAESYEEYTQGLSGIAAPIFDMSGRVQMVVAIVGLSTQVTPENGHWYGEKVKEAARLIADEIGGISTPSQVLSAEQGAPQ
ncbi:MAG: IclR family transcriptional regulator [Clostridia bacterium]|nr:IclR family transcriptional regulator [Clostridia bacterium]